jgi:hypothetical protein
MTMKTTLSYQSSCRLPLLITGVLDSAEPEGKWKYRPYILRSDAERKFLTINYIS